MISNLNAKALGLIEEFSSKGKEVYKEEDAKSLPVTTLKVLCQWKQQSKIVEILARANAKVRGIRIEGTTRSTYETKTKPINHSGLSANHNRGPIRTTKSEREHLRHKRPLRPLYKKQQLLPIALPPTKISQIRRPPLKYKQTYWPIKTSDTLVKLPAFSRSVSQQTALTITPSRRAIPPESNELNLSHLLFRTCS